MYRALRILREEHRSLAAVLHGLCHLARAAAAGDVRPRFEVFHAMLHYIDAFPERLHHPREDAYLFAALRERAPAMAPLVAALQAEHVEGAGRVRTLERALERFETEWPRGGHAFAAAAEDYADFHRRHMQREETELFPAARRALPAEDWRVIEAAFAGNDDPIADLREQDLERLYSRIVSLAPAPIGSGESWGETRAA
jgi:hemerythrin-like domain-containing protein